MSAVTVDARVAAIRWDVVPWGLVLDLDAPLSGAPEAPMRRVWLLFSGVSEVSWPIEEARLPNGCWLTSAIASADAGGGFREYRFTSLLPRFAGDVLSREQPPGVVVIRAQRLDGVASIEAHPANEHGVPWRERVRLASDEELARVLEAT
ncbi:hypothetical protein [Sorangium sp. So ce131]|uniref:hypothetical protein n=1 Tax=Sorangium sp. So ce131 TaxID=3133282 RepID=UPI003F5EFECD